MKEFCNPSDVHAPLASYTHQIQVTGPERWLVLSGQVGQSVDGTVPQDPIAQIDLAFENLFRNLRAAKMEVQDLVKITMYLVGEMDVAARRQVVAARLQGHKPCTTVVFVSALATPLYRVEIDAWATRAV